MGCQSNAGLPPALNSPVPIYTLGWREAPWEQSVLPKNTTQCPWPGPEPRPLHPESSALPMCSPHLPLVIVRRFFGFATLRGIRVAWRLSIVPSTSATLVQPLAPRSYVGWVSVNLNSTARVFLQVLQFSSLIKIDSQSITCSCGYNYSMSARWDGKYHLVGYNQSHIQQARME